MEDLAVLCERIGQRAVQRGLENYLSRFGMFFVYGDLYQAFTRDGSPPDDESVVNEMRRDSVLARWLLAGTSLASLREKG